MQLLSADLLDSHVWTQGAWYALQDHMEALQDEEEAQVRGQERVFAAISLGKADEPWRPASFKHFCRLEGQSLRGPAPGQVPYYL